MGLRTKRIKTARKASFRNSLLKTLLIIVIVSLVYLIIDFKGPKNINLKTDNVFGFTCQKAKDLVVQEYDKDGNLWATRGMIVYKLEKGDNKFEKIAHVPTGRSVFWLRNFTLVRRITLRPECVEMVVCDNNDIFAVSAGRMWHLPRGDRKFKETLQMSTYGFGDQGIRNDGIISVNDSKIYFGEYFQNSERRSVRIFKSVNNLTSWDVAYEFPPEQIRHIHAIQRDPYTDKLWVLTGDLDKESMVAWSGDGFNTINPIGQGSQIWRVCQLVFTEDYIYWGTDTGSGEVAGIYKWDKKTSKIEKLQGVGGAIFYGTRLTNGTVVMSSNRQDMANETDHKTRLFIIPDDNKISSFTCGTWNYHKPGFWHKYAKLRFQRNQGGPSLVITCLNLKEVRDGDLIIISEETLSEAVERQTEIN